MGNGVQGYGAYGQSGTWVWGTKGMGHISNRSLGQWGTGGMGHMGNEAHWGYEVQWYGAHGQ